MYLITVFLSIVLVLNAAFLTLLILIQLPKKEAGAGLAFGAGATDALFGAGSGNALTKMTKYAAGFFLGLVLVLAVLSQRRASQSNRSLEELLKKGASAPVAAPAVVPGTSNSVSPAVETAITTNVLKVTAPAPTPAPAPANNPAPAPLPSATPEPAK